MRFTRLLAPVALLLLAWGIFLTNIGRESLWHDEGITWQMASQPTLADLFAQYPTGTTHPPASFVYTWLWLRWTSTQDVVVMRLSSTLAMLLAVAVVYALGRAWLANRDAALAAAAFAATSGMLVYYARELRMYSLIVLLAALSWWLFVRVLERRTPTLQPARTRQSVQALPLQVAYGVLVALMAYTHYLSAFVVAAQALTGGLVYRGRIVRLVPAWGLAALLVVPWLPTFVAQTREASIRAGRDGSFTVGNVGQFNATEPTTPEAVAGFITQITAGQTAFAAALVVVALALGWGRRRLWLAFGWLVVTAALVFAVNPLVPIYSPRYLLPVVPALALLVGAGVGALAPRVRPALLAIIVVGGVAFHTTAFRPPHKPHNDIFGVISAGWLEGDHIWYNLSQGALGSSTQEEVQYYLTVAYPDLDDDDFVWDAPEDFSDPDYRRVWDVRPYWIPMPDAAAAPLNATRSITESYGFGEYRVRLYEAPPAGNPVVFGDLFALRASPIPARYRSGDQVMLRLWWQALETPTLDYSYALTLTDSASHVHAQQDFGLMLGREGDADRLPTSAWLSDAPPAVAVVRLPLPDALPPGDYRVWLRVYYWETADAPLAIDAPAAWTTDDAFGVQIAQFTVE